MKRHTATMLCVLLVLSSFGAGCDADSLRKAREASERLIIYSEAGGQILGEIKASGLISSEQYERAVLILTNIRGLTEAFLSRAMSYKKLDGSARVELARVFAYVIEGVREFEAAGQGLVEQILRRLGVKEPEKIVSRLRLVLSGLTVSARLIETRLRP